MKRNPAETIAQGNEIERCRIVLGSSFQIKPAAETEYTPEPKFEEVKHLYSDKPLRFNRPVLS